MKKLLLSILTFIFFQTLICQNVVNFSLTDTKGTHHDLYSYLQKRQAVVLDFFYATCGNCAAFVPMLEQIYQNYGQNAGWVKVVSMECTDTAASAVDAWKLINGGTYPTIAGSAAKSYWETNWVPTYGGSVNQVYVIIPDPYGQAQNSYVDFFNIGLMDASDVQQLEYSLTSHGFHQGIDFAYSENLRVRIYPNPAENFCNIHFNKSPDEKVLIEVFNLMGQRVISKNHSFKNNSNYNVLLELDKLENGNYIVKVQSSNFIRNLKIEVIK
ncbi:T9SS type A sorting domain-containing protein [Bacteroidota bacterium]